MISSALRGLHLVKTDGPARLVERFSIALIVAVVGSLTFASQPAFALLHNFSTSFAGSGANALSNPADVAVDSSTGPSAHDVYVTDPANHRVEKFTPAGEFLLMFGKEVNKTEVENPLSIEVEQNVCTRESGDICEETAASSSSPGGFETPTFVAVDNSPTGEGDVYVGDRGDSSVSKFTPEGALIATWATAGQLTGFGSLYGIAVDPSGNLFVLGESETSTYWYEQSGSLHSNFSHPRGSSPSGLAVDAEDNLYKVDGSPEITKFSDRGGGKGEPDTNGSTVGLAIDPSNNDLYAVEGGSVVDHFHLNCGQACTPFESFGTESIPLESFGKSILSEAQGIAVDADGTVYVADTGHSRIAVFSPTLVPELTTGTKVLSQTSVTLTGKVKPGTGGEVTECQFEYGEEKGNYTLGTIPCQPATHFTGEKEEVHAEISGLTPLVTYHFRLLTANAKAADSSGDQTLLIPLPPAVGTESISEVATDVATIHAQIEPGGGDTTYHVEYLTSEQLKRNEEEGEEEFANAEQSPSLDAGSANTPQGLTARLSGLKAGTTYHYRVAAENALEAVTGLPHTFATYPFTPVLLDRCPNAHVRQQTGSAEALDCRAYELVSATNAGGYDVESDLVAGQTPYAGYPEAQTPSGEPLVLYGVHDGGIPGTNHPTNRGVDPYIATRGKEGWSTEYVGIPANNPFAAAPFSSVPTGADSSLETFAFGGPGSCSPCFEGEYTGIPVRLANGELVQGMVGSMNPGHTAKPDGLIAKDLSANGEHLIFGSTSKFEPGGNNETGDVSIYDHNLTTGETHVVSNTPEGEGHPLPCLQGAHACHSPGDSNGIAELAISKDGSRILLAQKVFEDADGNAYWHLYMDIGDSERTIDLTPEVIATPSGPGFTEGVLFDGMTEDGSKVFFTTKDALHTATNQDTDSSADIYEAEVSEAGALTLTRASTGIDGTGNSDACDPVSNSNGSHWNTVGSTEDCGVVAIGGGGGVASGDGSIYFLSPELLDGPTNGTQNQPNLYLAAPGQAPSFVATLSPEDPLVLDAAKEAEARKTADFQVTPSGEFAVFTSTLPLPPSTKYDSAGHSEIYRYDASAEELNCASCDPTRVEPSFGSTLASNGLSLTDDGRVFFTTAEPLVARDLDEKADVYEWEPAGTGNCQESSQGFSKASGTCLELISTGTSPFDSGLLSVSARGTDVYFFTRDSLVPQDQNGTLTKIYDARELGGFLFIPQPPACAASDECHGPGSQAQQVPPIRSVAGGPGNVTEPKKCKPSFVSKHGRCVKKHPKRHHKSNKRHGKRSAHSKRRAGE